MNRGIVAWVHDNADLAAGKCRDRWEAPGTPSLTRRALADAFGRVMPESMEFARRHFPHLIGFFVTDQRLEEHLAPEARAARFHPLWDHLAGAMPERHGAGALENRVARLLRRRELLQGKSASTNSPGWTRVSDNSL